MPELGTDGTDVATLGDWRSEVDTNSCATLVEGSAALESAIDVLGIEAVEIATVVLGIEADETERNAGLEGATLVADEMMEDIIVVRDVGSDTVVAVSEVGIEVDAEVRDRLLLRELTVAVGLATLETDVDGAASTTTGGTCTLAPVAAIYLSNLYSL